MGNANGVDIEAVKAAELEVILGRPGEPAPKDGSSVSPAIWGLALSGGGIRAATFSLGVLQELARLKVLLGFHYQSTVSGGGYTGAFLQALIERHGFDGAIAVLNASVSNQAADSGTGSDKSTEQSGKTDAKNQASSDGTSHSEKSANATASSSAKDNAQASTATKESDKDKKTPADPRVIKRNNLRPILHLREYSNYLSPRKAALSGDTLGMFGTYLRNVILIQIQLCALLVALSLLPLFLYPWIRHIAISWPGSCLLCATALGFIAALLLGLVTTSTRRSTSESDNAESEPDPRSRTRWHSEPEQLAGVTDKTELAGIWIKKGAVGIIWALALSAVFAAFGLWGWANNRWTIGRCDAVNTPRCAPSFSESNPTYGDPFTVRDHPSAWANTTPSSAATSPAPDNPDKAKPKVKHAFVESLVKKVDLPPSSDSMKKADPFISNASAANVSTQPSQDNTTAPLPRGEFFYCTFVLYLVVWIAWLIYDEPKRSRLEKNVPADIFNRIARVLFAAVIAGAFLGGSLNGIRDIFHYWNENAGLWRAIIFGPVLTLAAFMLTGVLQLGLAGSPFTDLQREVWARVGGKTTALTLIGIALPTALVVIGPWLYRSDFSTSWLGSLQVGTIITWIVTTGSGVAAAYTQSGNDQKKTSMVLDVIARVAPWVFLLGLIIAISTAAQAMPFLTGGLKLDYPGNPNLFLEDLGKILSEQAGCHLAIILVAAFLTWGVFGLVIDINEFSLNAFYRNRLVRCYLGASNPERNPEPTTNFDPKDDIVLSDVVMNERLPRRSEVKEQGVDFTRPLFPIIGATLNLLAVKQLDWLQRKAASFFFTPGYCGYLPPPSHPWSEPVGDANSKTAGTLGLDNPVTPPRSVATRMTLGDAIAISGAAVSPNMGYHSSPAATFLLTIFDARLGWWMRNPRLRRKNDFATVFWGGWLLKEMLGLTDETGKFVYLSDGGHFENLGVYELVRRRCHFILVVDASADPNRDFEDLGNAVQKCRTDFGVDINIDVSGLRTNDAGISLRSCALGRIEYPAQGTEEKKTGLLLYIKPTLTGKEPADVAYYAHSHPSFPHEPTYIQFFDEAQFESYRRLGVYITQNALEPSLDRVKSALAKASASERASAWEKANASEKANVLMEEEIPLNVHDSDKKEKMLEELGYRWAHFPKKPTAHALTHLNAMSRLFGELRRDPDLSGLDAQLYPAWAGLLRSVGCTDGDDAADNERVRKNPVKCQGCRKRFYFCQELAHLMESIYHDLDLERYWNHIDNRGWMNAFRQWGTSLEFRKAWVVGSPNYGARYVAFCHQWLDFPQLADTLAIKYANRLPGLRRGRPTAARDWHGFCQELLEKKHINKIECSALKSLDFKPDDVKDMDVYLLQMNWGSMAMGAMEVRREPTGEAQSDHSTLGVAVVRDEKIVLFRIQNHLRRLGLGKEFMRMLVEAGPDIKGVEIAEGNYGMLGLYTKDRARRAAARMLALLRKTQAQRLRNKPKSGNT